MKLLKSFLVFLLSMGAVYADAPEAPSPAAPAVELTPGQTQESLPVSYEGAFAKMLLTLAGLIVLIFLTVWVLRRLSQGRFGGGGLSSRSIKILERRALSHKSILYVVEIGGKKIVIAESQLEVRPITTLDELPEND